MEKLLLPKLVFIYLLYTMEKTQQELIAEYVEIKQKIEAMEKVKDELQEQILSESTFEKITIWASIVERQSRQTFTFKNKECSVWDVQNLYPSCVKTKVEVDAKELMQFAPQLVDVKVSNFLKVSKAK